MLIATPTYAAQPGVPFLGPAPAAVTDADLRWLRRSFELARQAARHGDRPFGAVLADADGQLLAEDANAEATERSCTAHAEANLVREATGWFPRSILAAATAYASAEPCPMCAGALYWAGVRRVVYGLSGPRLYQLLGDPPDQMGLRCADVLATGRRGVEVVGPILEDEAAAAFAAAHASLGLRRAGR